MINTQSAAPARATNHKELPLKIIALQHLMNKSLNRLDALALFNDTCFNSTISTLSNKHGLVFNRVSEPHTHRNGGTVHFKRYTLAEESRSQAEALINSYTRREAA